MKKKIVGILVCILLITTVLSVSGTVIVERTPISTSLGDTLYVGGSGPGNYSSIQSAINDAEDGDTVFVYDDSSPYNERLRVDKSINLIGEDRETTIIHGGGFDVVVSISTDSVLIQGFTIEFSGNDYNVSEMEFDAGIRISSDYNTITDNIISLNKVGVFIRESNYNTITGNDLDNSLASITLYNTIENIISENSISADNSGISIWRDCDSNTISRNDISDSKYGIRLSGCDTNNIISENTIENTRDGIIISSASDNNIVSNNMISGSTRLGLSILYSANNAILRNTFINNEKDANFWYFVGDILRMNLLRITNKWNNNYWSEPQTGPYKIHGNLKYSDYSILFGRIDFNIPWLNFDWHPAQEPYDIGV